MANPIPSDDQEFTFDFSQVADTTLIPPGTYTAELVAVKPGKSGAGHPKWDVRWKISSEDPAIDGRLVFDTVSFHPERMIAVKRFFAALGCDVSGQLKIMISDVLFKSARVTVGIEDARVVNGTEYEARNRVNRVKPLGENASVDELFNEKHS